MYTAYIGFYPRRNILKTWRSLGVTGRTPDEAVKNGIAVRDQFLIDNDGMCNLEVQIEARKGKDRYPQYVDARALIQYMDEHKIDRALFPKENGGSKVTV